MSNRARVILALTAAILVVVFTMIGIALTVDSMKKMYNIGEPPSPLRAEQAKRDLCAAYFRWTVLASGRVEKMEKYCHFDIPQSLFLR